MLLLVLSIIYLGVILFPNSAPFSRIPEKLIAFAFIMTYAFELFFNIGPLSPFMLTTGIIAVVTTLLRLILPVHQRQ
jgi:hypothetical protein